MLVILLFFLALVVIDLAVNSFLTSITPALYLNALLPYITCESAGLDSGTDCQPFLSNVQRTDTFNLSLSRLFFVAFLPLVVFLFGADFRLFSKKLGEPLHRLRTYSKSRGHSSLKIAR